MNQRRPWVLTLILAALASLTGCVVASQTQAADPDSGAPKRILFVGNSYLYYNDSIHNHVRRIAEENGPYAAGAYQYKSATIGGARLSHHNIDSLLEPGRLGIDEPFDLVILQGGSSEPLTAASRTTFEKEAVKLSRKIRSTGADVALYMTHAYVKPHAKFDPAMIEKIEPTYVETAKAINAWVIPVGLAFQRAYAERPSIELHKPFDGSHPSLLGSYLAACVVYVSIYTEPCSGIEYTYFGAVDLEDASFLRRIADETVREFSASQKSRN